MPTYCVVICFGKACCLRLQSKVKAGNSFEKWVNLYEATRRYIYINGDFMVSIKAVKAIYLLLYGIFLKNLFNKSFVLFLIDET